MTRFTLPLAAASLCALALATGCGGTAADTASDNISKQAEQFKVGRRIVVTNGITGKPVFMIEGRCSFETYGDRFDVICKEGPGKYRKATIIRGDQDSAASVQLDPINVSEYRTKIILRPETLLPDFDLVTGEQG